MKRFKLNGNLANWPNLNVTALDTKSGIATIETKIPEHLDLIVSLIDGFNPLDPDLTSINPANFGYAVRHGKKRHFILFNSGRIVGWAHFHRKPKEYTVNFTCTTTDTATVTAKSEAEAIKKVRQIAIQQYRGELLEAHVVPKEDVDAAFNGEEEFLQR